MTGAFRTRGNVNAEAVVDDHGVQVGIEYPHDAVHRDILVTASEVLADLDIAGPRRYLISAPAGMDIHLVAAFGASQACRIELFKSPTVQAEGAGTALQKMRHQIFSAKTSETVVTHTPTLTAEGTQIFSTRLFASTGGNPNTQVGGSTRSGEEIIVKSGEKVLVKITAEADNTILTAAFEYYEVAV